jgi:hypothetical protein
MYLNPKRLVLGTMLITAIGADRKRFEKSCRDVEAVQESFLMKLLARHARSDFGESFGFSRIKSVKEFQNALPIADYEDFRPYVDKVVNGKVDALFAPEEKVLMFALTSGTTGMPKYIPVTETFLQAYRRGWRIWGAYVCNQHLGCWKHQFMNFISPMAEKYTDRGVPCGSISGLMAEMQPSIVRKYYALPPEISKIGDPDIKLYVTMRVAVAQKVSFLSTPNPSTILQLVTTADARREDIIRDVADGTCKGIDRLDESIKAALRPYLKKDVRAARRLEDIVRRTSHLYPKDYWVELGLIACWTGGPLRLYTDDFGRFFGDAAVRDLGLLATECRMTIPMQDNDSAGALDIENNFFEFVPEDRIEDPSPIALLPQELRIGEKYFIILTTHSGLYRYNISDVVEVVDFFHGNPVVRFLNKGSHISSITGEKVSEYQVVCAMEQVKRKLALEVEDFAVGLCVEHVPRYCILIEKDKIKNDGIAERIMREFDNTLGNLNIEYKKKRESKRLMPVSLRLLPPMTLDDRVKRLCEERGGRLEQFKHKYLLTDGELSDIFTTFEEKFVGM